MLQNQNKCHSEPVLQSLTHEESHRNKEMKKVGFGLDRTTIHDKGITLIALVVTLVVLLILAGITISIVLSEGGIIAKAQSSKEKQEVAVWLDRLTVTEANTAVTRYAVDMEKYNAQLKTEGIVLEDNSNYQSEDGGKTYNLTTDNGYVFNISEPTPGDIVINYIGKNGELLPYIKEIKVISTTTNSSKIEVDVARLEDGKLTYEYKKHAEENYTLLKENKELTAEFIGLTQKETYDIKVTAENKNGKSEAKIISIYTGELQEGTISQKGETVWSNNQASIELQTTDTVNTMQYQKNDITGTWTNYTGVITGLVYQERIYARMFDGINGNSPFSVDILDDIQPQTATINLSTTTTDTATPITATITQTDNESGVDITKCKWVYNTTNTEIGTNEASYTGGTFSTNSQTISLNASSTGTYYLHVLTIDKAGNKKETVSGVVTVNQLATGISLNQTTANMYTGDTLTLTATVTPSNTTNKNVTWVSSNTVVATVTNGIVIAKGQGTTTITATTQDGSNKTATCNLTVIPSIASIKAGDYIAYTGGGYSSWRVLWEANNSTAGNGNSIQIISTGSVKYVALEDNYFDTAKNNYNTAIAILNNEAMPYINATYAIDARCVGSVPNNKNAESGNYTRSDSWFSQWNGKFKNTDTNYEKDWNKMNTLGIQNIGYNYWLASRFIYSESTVTNFCVRSIYASEGLLDKCLCDVRSDYTTRGRTPTSGRFPPCSISKI